MSGRVKSGVRVAGGVFRGRLLRVPKEARPTVGRVREALFSIWRAELEGARVLDLFAGSGVVGVEAAGRGAREVIAIEASAGALKALQANLEALSATPVVRARLGRVPAVLAQLARQRPASFDLIFADPPYRYADYAELLCAVRPLLADDGQLAVEHDRRVELPAQVEGMVRVEARHYGESSLAFYRRKKKAISSK